MVLDLRGLAEVLQEGLRGLVLKSLGPLLALRGLLREPLGAVRLNAAIDPKDEDAVIRAHRRAEGVQGQTERGANCLIHLADSRDIRGPGEGGRLLQLEALRLCYSAQG